MDALNNTEYVLNGGDTPLLKILKKHYSDDVSCSFCCLLRKWDELNEASV